MKLKDYSKIDTTETRTLLLGNGFSIGVSRQFSYSSLRAICVQQDYLSDADAKLFTEFKSNDFELLLDKLDTAASVNKILDIDYKTPLKRYAVIRDALIKAVKFVHPNFSTINSHWIELVSQEFGNYKAIFTTNYDLLIYWITGTLKFKNFTDYFWSNNLTFDQFNTEIWDSKIPILYLHGSLCLYKEMDRVKKIKAIKVIQDTDSYKNLLLSIEKAWQGNSIPVFVSESSSSEKMNAIYSDPYLTFAFSEFLKIKGEIIIFGHSLAESDQHLVKAINNNKQLTKISVSLYRGSKTDDEIEDEINRITSQLKQFTRRNGTNLEFFDSATCPLSYQEDISN